MNSGILTPSATRELLDRLGHRPKRQLGQNFLVDGNIVRKSLTLASINPGDQVVEVGPGLGTLTGALLETGADVFAVERDPVLAAHLRESLVPRYPERLHLLEGDAVEHPLAALPAGENSDFKIVANLPYAISTPWMETVLAGPLPSVMVLMLQKEAAQRFAAQPGSKNFGAISIFLQSAFTVAAGHRVAAACFYPRPDVESYLLPLVRRSDASTFSAPVRQTIRNLFQQRRKQIGSLVKQRPEVDPSWLESLNREGLDTRARPEDIPLSAWQRLTVHDRR